MEGFIPRFLLSISFAVGAILLARKWTPILRQLIMAVGMVVAIMTLFASEPRELEIVMGSSVVLLAAIFFRAKPYIWK